MLLPWLNGDHFLIDWRSPVVPLLSRRASKGWALAPKSKRFWRALVEATLFFGKTRQRPAQPTLQALREVLGVMPRRLVERDFLRTRFQDLVDLSGSDIRPKLIKFG